jgi:Cu/Ag efflux protein CusF
MIVAALNWTLMTVLFIGKDKAKCEKVKSSTQIRSRWQNILTKLLGVIGQARKATTPFEAWKLLSTDKT